MAIRGRRRGATTRARLLRKRGSAFAGSSIQGIFSRASQSRSAWRDRSRSGRSSIRPRPSGQTGEGDQSFNWPSGVPCARIQSASAISSAVWPIRMTRAPAVRAAFDRRAWRAWRAAAGSPLSGLSPDQIKPRQPALSDRAIASTCAVQAAAAGFSAWSTLRTRRRRPRLAAQWAARCNKATESPPPETATATG